MKNIIHDLYFGRISEWENRIIRSDEEMAIHDKIIAEKQYFSGVLSAEDYKRLESLETLCMESHNFDELRAYVNAFKLGVMIMCAVFMGDGTEN